METVCLRTDEVQTLNGQGNQEQVEAIRAGKTHKGGKLPET